MAFQQAEIGPKYDLGLATRDGTTLACVDDNGAPKQVSQMAYMFSAQPGREQTETTDLVRKQQLTRLSSANVIDREFTLNPQVTQGLWLNGELQRVFTDTAAYYQGRGLSLSTSPNAPSAPFTTNVTVASSSSLGRVAGGVYNNIPGYCTFFTVAGTTFMGWVTPGGVTQVTLTGVSNVNAATVINNNVYFTNGTSIFQVSAGTVTTFAAAAAPAYPLVSGLVGNKFYLAVVAGSTSIKIFDATNAASVTTIAIPATMSVRSMAFSGSQLIIALTDGNAVTFIGTANGAHAWIIAYDIPTALTTNVTDLGAYQEVQMAAVSGILFVAAATNMGTSNGTIDCYLLVGSALQFIATIPPLLNGTGTLTASQAANNLFNVVSYGPYAIVPTYISPGTVNVLYAYDVQRGAFYTLGDFPVIGTSTVAGGFAITSNPRNSAAWAIVYGTNGATTTIATEFAFNVFLGSGAIVLQPGRVISSLIDFTSAQTKLFRQIVVTHNPIPAGGQVTLNAYLDVDTKQLPGTVPLQIVNTTVGATTTTLLINKLARKVLYLLDWTGSVTTNAAAPISVIVQAATGWIMKVFLALSNSARMNSQAPNSFAYAQQGFDAKTAYNFLRQLWRLKGGLCLGTFSNGDQYNAAIESIDFASPQPLAVTTSGDRKTRYEVTAVVTLREDL